MTGSGGCGSATCSATMSSCVLFHSPPAMRRPYGCVLTRSHEQCRALEAKLAASQTRSGFGPARVVWMSSLGAYADAFDADDWQLVQSERPYEGSKFQNDLVCTELARRAGPSPTAAVRHITVHPGVVDSLIDAALVGSFSAKIKLVVMYLVRCLSFSSPPFFFALLSWRSVRFGFR